MTESYLPYLFIIAICGIVILYFYLNNSTRRIERYYLKNNKGLFVLLEICMIIIVMSILFNIRHIIVMFLMNRVK